MDVQATVDEQLLAQAKRQTAALESLRRIALGWVLFTVGVAVLWLLLLVVQS